MQTIAAPLPRTFAALGDPTRFAIVDRLAREGEMTVAELSDGLPLTAPAISRHLKVLTKADVLERRSKGTHRLYSVRPQAIEAIGAWTMSHRDFWEASLRRLDAALTQEMRRK